MSKINYDERFSPLIIKLDEIHDLKQYINNSHLPAATKRTMMKTLDREWNKAWRNHYAGIKGYEIFHPHPMRDVTRLLKKRYGMTNINVAEYNGNVENIHAENDAMVILIVPPHDKMKKWLLRVAPRATFDRWTNSVVIEMEFDNKHCLTHWLTMNKDHVVEKLLESLSKEVKEMRDSEND